MSGSDRGVFRGAGALVLGLAAVTLIAACGGGDAPADTPPPTTDTPAASTPAEGGDLVAQGRRVFLGQESGAICVTCHGQDATGIAGLGPNLTDGNWLHIDGSVESIENLVRTGVMEPKEVASVMPPYGGVPFSDEALHAVATYIHSLNQ